MYTGAQCFMCFVCGAWKSVWFRENLLIYLQIKTIDWRLSYILQVLSSLGVEVNLIIPRHMNVRFNELKLHHCYDLTTTDAVKRIRRAKSIYCAFYRFKPFSLVIIPESKTPKKQEWYLFFEEKVNRKLFTSIQYLSFVWWCFLLMLLLYKHLTFPFYIKEQLTRKSNYFMDLSFSFFCRIFSFRNVC